MRLSVSMFGAPIGAYADVARCADELGYEALWIPEHLALPLDYAAKYPYQASGKLGFEPDTPFADPWVMFGHLAAVTKQLQLGVGVFVLPLRNPFVVAKAAATAQILSNGRVLMGVGIGAGNYWAMSQSAVPRALVGRALGFQNMMAQVAGALAPLITGYLLGDGQDYTAAIVVAGASPLIAVGALLLFVKSAQAA